MNPLNTFPGLLDYARLSPFVLRVIVGVFLILLGKKRMSKEYSWISIFYFIFGATIFAGFYTQISAIAGIALLKIDFYLDYWKNRSVYPVTQNTYMLYWISSLVLVSLLLSGAGLLAFDLPF